MKKIEPRTLSGFMELLPNEQILFNQIIEIIENTYKNFDSTTFVESIKINRKDLFNALVTELGINKIIVTKKTKLVYDNLTNNYSKASSYTGDTSYYEDFITFTVTLKEDKSKHIIVAYNDGTYADYKF